MLKESVRLSNGCVALAGLLAMVVLGAGMARAEVLPEGKWYYEGEIPYEGELPPEGEGEPPFQSHPADANGDGRMTMSEAIGYLACWQQGSCLMSYAIRAAYLWQNGEGYTYDASLDPPMCWELPAPAEGEVMYSLMLGLGAVNPEYIHGSITPAPEPDEMCLPLEGQPWCGLYPEGTEVWLTPVPDAGYAFDHWTGDLSGNQVPALVVMNDDKHVIAEFVALAEGEGEIPVEGEPVVVPGELVDVPAGTFQMGDPWNEGGEEERPVHAVTLDAYWIGKYEVTNQEYADVLNWAHGRGYLTNSGGGAYTGGLIYAYNRAIADTETSSSYSQLTYSGGVFGVRSRAGHGGVLYSMADHPVVWVSWYGAVCYCNWLSEQQGLQACYDTATWTRYEPVRIGYRLPTEAEWERAAAWDGSRHWRYGMTSDTIDNTRANYCESGYANPLRLTGYPYTSPVGWYNGVNPARVSAPGTLTVNATSPVGAYDMSGNVWEWCHDWYDQTYYAGGAMTNPLGPSAGSSRVLRGGSWVDSVWLTRSADRSWSGPDSRYIMVEFRVAVSSR
ncbi:MAG TPA: SUMF1/EgtB/PvdO family nonheme iron enzyme [Candidatus Hydrogenedentes bacterium]|nr:SUMF1/EgtB/PvdO family nonheme iron enzyme [Candidatus Hydrogenedentota bacterium]HOC70814.1 SUMF1/EgtB/PvdO family nonheme iron enzyme [Candidatus Hydrogenedentota bacterium]